MIKTNWHKLKLRTFIAAVILIIIFAPILMLNLQRKLYKPPSRIKIVQQEWIEKIKQADRHSVLIYTEEIGDDVKPLIVRHYARYTEIGTIEFWTEQIKE